MAQHALDATPAGARESGTPIIKETTTQTFAADVLTESARQPVLVDFWAPWCEPCKQLRPILEKVVKAAGGKIKLVTMNIDEHPEIAGRLGVRSIPAVIAFQKSQPVDGFMGALPESQLRGFIERLIGPVDGGTDRLAEAEAALAQGDAAGAAEIFAELAKERSERCGGRLRPRARAYRARRSRDRAHAVGATAGDAPGAHCRRGPRRA